MKTITLQLVRCRAIDWSAYMVGCGCERVRHCGTRRMNKEFRELAAEAASCTSWPDVEYFGVDVTNLIPLLLQWKAGEFRRAVTGRDIWGPTRTRAGCAHAVLRIVRNGDMSTGGVARGDHARAVELLLSEWCHMNESLLNGLHHMIEVFPYTTFFK